MSDNSRIIVVVDDNDSRVTYGGERGTAWSNSSNFQQEYQSSSHSTTSTSAWAQFTFNGTLVTVYGTLEPSSGNSSYTLDDEKPVVYSPVATLQGLRFHEPFYVSPILPFGQHTLNISLIESGKSLRLDSFQITTTAASESLNSALGQNMTTSAANIVTTSTTPDPSGRKSLPPGVIAGVAIAGTVLFLIVIAVVVWVALRQKKHRKQLVAPSEASPGRGFDILEGSDDLNAKKETILARLLPPYPAAQSPQTQTSTTRSAAPSTAIFSSIISVPPIPSSSGGTSAASTRAFSPYRGR